METTIILSGNTGSSLLYRAAVLLDRKRPSRSEETEALLDTS
jgi:hypothetical protein